jgi:hypothetical protein
MPVILATQEAEFRWITVQGQFRQHVSETAISTKKVGIVKHACHLSQAGSEIGGS